MKSVDITGYFNSHLVKPKGIGTWIFQDEYGDCVSFLALYSVAVKAAKKALKGTFIIVLP